VVANEGGSAEEREEVFRQAFAAAVQAAVQAAAAYQPGGWVGRAAKVPVARSFSSRPPAEPDLMVPDHPALQ
jgi:hypothetical protein